MVVMNDDLHGMIQVNMALKKFHTFCFCTTESTHLGFACSMLGKKVPNILSQMLIYHGRIRKIQILKKKTNPNHSSEKSTVSKPSRMSQKVSKWFVNVLFHLLIDGACWGDITHLLQAFDPNFQRYFYQADVFR